MFQVKKQACENNQKNSLNSIESNYILYKNRLEIPNIMKKCTIRRGNFVMHIFNFITGWRYKS